MRISYKEMDTKKLLSDGSKKRKNIDSYIAEWQSIRDKNRKPMLRYYVGMGNKNNV